MRPPARADFLTRERGYMVNPQHMDLLLMLAGLGDVVGGLHPQERIHLHSKGFLNAERNIRRFTGDAEAPSALAVAGRCVHLPR